MPNLDALLAEIGREYHRAEPHFATIVREAGITRVERTGLSSNPAVDVDLAIDAAAPKSRVRKAHISDVLVREMDRMQSPLVGVSTPFRMLNHAIVGGLQPGELAYLGARPAVGKSALALEFARHVAKQGFRTLVVSREMSDLALARRMLAQEGRLPASKLRLGQVDMRDVAAVAERLANLPIWITDTASTLAEINEMADDSEFVIVDYLQILEAPRGLRDKRAQIEHSSKHLKELATSRRLPVLCLSSLSRPEKGSNREPTMADLRESGQIEHDADIVLLLHKPDSMGTNVKCIIEKNRDGEIGRVDLVFKPEWVSFFQAEQPSWSPEPPPHYTDEHDDRMFS
jgi:replicative DNA helicase